jgi:hypothetical protein
MISKFTPLIVALACFATVRAQSVPELLYYKFDGAGTTIPNLASNPPAGTATATIMGGVTQGGSNICDGTLIGTGAASSTDYVNTGWAPALGSSSWSIAFRTSNIGASSTLFYIFGDANTGSWRCFTNGVAGPNNWILRGPISDISIPNGAVVAQTLNIFVYDAAAGQTRAYLNGTLVSTVTQAAPNVTGTGPFKVCGYGTNVGLPASGYMDEFRMYSHALTAVEIAELAAGVTVNNFLPADSALCAGDTLTLTAPSSSASWSTGATASSITAQSPGTYSASFSNICYNGADTVTLSAIPLLTGGFLGGDITVCTDDTTQLLADSTAQSFLWSNGDTSSSIIVVGPGTYSVDVTGACNVASDTITLIPSALVYSGFLNASATTVCAGDTISLSSNTAYTSYLWSDSSTGSTLSATTTGNYSLTVMDGCGAGTESVSLTFTPGPTASFTSSTTGLSASFTNNSTGSSPTYLWDFGDAGTSTFANPSHTYAANGTYTVTLTVTDACGTSVFTSTVTVSGVAIDPAIGFDIAVYPNPAKNAATLSATLPAAQHLKFSVLNALGQVIVAEDLGQQAGEFKHSFSLQGFSDGIYFVRLETENGPITARLTVRN